MPHNEYVKIIIRKYIVPITDKKYHDTTLLIENDFLNLDIGSYIQILRKGYYKKISDELLIEVNDGRKV